MSQKHFVTKPLYNVYIVFSITDSILLVNKFWAMMVYCEKMGQNYVLCILWSPTLSNDIRADKHNPYHCESIPYGKSAQCSSDTVTITSNSKIVDAVDNSKAMNESREEFITRNNLQDKPVIAMLAGSRKGEISTMMPVLTEFAAKMRQIPQYADYQFIVAGAPSRSIKDYEAWLTEENKDYVKVLFGETQSVIRHAAAAVVNSGTASLETVLFNTPQIVGYITNPITYWIARKIIKIKYISLGNLIVDRLAFKEYIQNDCNADALVTEVRRLIENEEYRERMLDNYADIRNELGGSGASAAVAEAMIKEL